MELSRPLATVTSALDGDVLMVLAGADATFTTGELHRMLAAHSEHGIRKALQRLVGQGIVDVNRVGNAFTYRLNRDHLAAEHIIGLARIWETLLKRIEDRLASWHTPPVYAAVFGSAARGSMRPDSDIDLLLVRPDDTDEDAWQTQVVDLIIDATRWTGNDTRPLEFTATDVAVRGPREPVLRDVLDEGVTVAGSRAWLMKQLRKR